MDCFIELFILLVVVQIISSSLSHQQLQELRELKIWGYGS